MTEIRHPDRRGQPRAAAHYLLTVTPSEAARLGPPVYTGLTLDVSETGAHIETSVPLVLGEELDLQIAVEDHLVLAHGRAVHTELLPDGLFGAGIRFSGPGVSRAGEAPLAGRDRQPPS